MISKNEMMKYRYAGDDSIKGVLSADVWTIMKCHKPGAS